MSQFGGREEKKGEKYLTLKKNAFSLGKKKIIITEVFLPEVFNPDPSYKRLNAKHG